MKFEDWLTLSFLVGPRLGFLTALAYACGGALVVVAILLGLFAMMY